MGIRGAAVIGLAAEDREQNGRRHAELMLDGVERHAVLLVKLAALRRELLDRRLFEIIGRRLDKFGLCLRRLLRPAGQDEIGQRQIRLEPARRGFVCRARHAERLRLRPQRLQPGLEGGVGISVTNTKRAAQQNSAEQSTEELHRTARMNSRGNRNSTLPS